MRDGISNLKTVTNTSNYGLYTYILKFTSSMFHEILLYYGDIDHVKMISFIEKLMTLNYYL